MLKKNPIAALFLSVVATLLVFLVVVTVGSRATGIEPAPIATICGAAAVSASAIVALFAFQHSRRTTQEPWLVTFRELHKEFWNDFEMARVRSWLCCDEAYQADLRPILAKRSAGQVNAAEYAQLEILDRFCALMLRVVHMQDSGMSNEQLAAYKKLGYYYWLYLAKGRTEIAAYIERHWEHLHPYVRDAKFHGG